MGSSFCSLKGASSGKGQAKKGRLTSADEDDPQQQASGLTTSSQPLHLLENIPAAVHASEDCPEDAWLAILRCLDARTLLQDTSSVCRKWRELSRSDLVWVNKLPLNFPRQRQGDVPLWRMWMAIFRVNLLADPNWGCPLNSSRSHSTWMTPKTPSRTGEWMCTRRGRDPLFLEVPPVGVYMEEKSVLPPLDLYMRGERRLMRVDCAVATSYDWSEIVQAVDLVQHLEGMGLSSSGAESFLDSGFSLQCSVWIGSREDKEGEAVVMLVLDDGETELPRYNGRPPGVRAGDAWAHSWTEHALTHVSTELYALEQGWRHVHLHLTEGAPGARRATLVLRGRDTNERRGNFGPKFMAPQLRFWTPDEGSPALDHSD